MKTELKRCNENTQKVLDAPFLAFYKGTLVLKAPIGHNAFSLGVIVLGRKVRSEALLLHEYGHRLQLKAMGFFRYFTKIFIPSVTANILERQGKLPYDYYGSPWEKEADILGKVSRKCTDWPCEAASFKNLLKMFRKRR